MNRESIIKNNKRYGIETIFYSDELDIIGYSLNNTIYLNTNSTADLNLANRHELFHFFEETENFLKTKEIILNLLEKNHTLSLLREEYSLKYYGLYSEEKINNGLIDTEIVIDLLTGISKYSTEFIRQLGNDILNQVAKEVVNKRYLVLNLRKNVANIAGLSAWEKIFIENYYNQVNYDGKTPILSGNNNQDQIRHDIQDELNKLYNIQPSIFTISPDSKDVVREFESELKILETRGKGNAVAEANNKKAIHCKKLADMFSKKLYEEYQHIVNFIKGANYEDAFKALVLRETLLKTYKKDKGNILIGKRKLNETIKGHMILNDITLDYMYENVAQYDNFAKLYDKSLNKFDEIILEKNNVSLDNVETYGKGSWIKFEGKTSNPEGYLNNVQELAGLVYDTPWCTKTLAASQLADGDFYVFVDNENKPHVAVKLTGNSISEVRGIQNDNAQELENDYREVVLSFLENNQFIKGGIEWYEKELWNQRLINYIKKIEDGTFDDSEIENLIYDTYHRSDYKSHYENNSNVTKLKEKLYLIKDKFVRYYAKLYNCLENEIYAGDYKPGDEKVCPYKVILGSADFKGSNVTDLGELEIVKGNLNTSGSKVEIFGNLKHVKGNIKADLLTDNLPFDKLNEYLYNRYKKIIQNINKYYSEYLPGKEIPISEDSIIEETPDSKRYNLESLRQIIKLAKEKMAEYYHCKEEEICIGDYKPVEEKICPYKVILGDAYFEKKQIEDLGNLETVLGNLFEYGSIKNYGKLASIKGRYIVLSYLQSGHNVVGKIDLGKDKEKRAFMLWNQNLVRYKKEIENGTFKTEEIAALLMDVYGSKYAEYVNYGGSNLTDLKYKIRSIKDKIAAYCNCEENEIWFDDLEIYSGNENQFKAILGNAFICGIDTLKNLQFIAGNANFFFSGTTDLGSLKVIGGRGLFKGSRLTSLGDLEMIGSDADFSTQELTDFGNLKYVGGKVRFNNPEQERLYNEHMSKTHSDTPPENKMHL